MGAPRLLIVFTLATVGVVLIVVALASGEWWLLPVAVLVHATATAVAVGAIGGAMKQKGKPDPVTEARLDEESDEPGDGGRRDDDEPRMAI